MITVQMPSPKKLLVLLMILTAGFCPDGSALAYGSGPYGSGPSERSTAQDDASLKPGKPMDSIDFTGVIKKFDTAFDGVGPRVYFLPAPPSENELMNQQYLAKQYEITMTIPELLSKSYTLTDFRAVGNTGPGAKNYTGELQSVEGWLLMEIARATQIADFNRVADMHHLLACEYFRLGITEDAFAFFEKALLTKTELRKQADVMAIRHNIAALYEYTGELACAEALYEANYQQARRANDREQQAFSLMRLALVKAKQGQHYEAEQDLIRTVLPMYKQIHGYKGDSGRIIAYNTLAEVYRLQNRYPEAQWFLLQAKEIVDTKQLGQFLPGILFSLAEAKKSSGNKLVAIDEYKLADRLASGREDTLVMRLAIQDALGDIYHETGNFKEALEALNRYDSLKEQLIAMDFPF